MKRKKKSMQLSLKDRDVQLTEARSAIRAHTDGAALRESAEVRALRNKGLECLRAHVKEAKHTSADLLKGSAKGADASKVADFVAFVVKLPLALRWLEVGEVVELHEGPVNEYWLDRVRCRTLQAQKRGCVAVPLG